VKTAANLIERIRNLRSRVHVVVAVNGDKRAVCGRCKTWRAPDRSELHTASDDAFVHFCETGHPMATPRVRASLYSTRAMR
jgi:hypothetical protein